MSESFEYKMAQAELKSLGLLLKPAEFRAKETDMLNRLGRDGWECFHVDSSELPTLYYMKRKT